MSSAAGSTRHKEELDFSISSLIKVGFVKEKLSSS